MTTTPKEETAPGPSGPKGYRRWDQTQRLKEISISSKDSLQYGIAIDAVLALSGLVLLAVTGTLNIVTGISLVVLVLWHFKNGFGNERIKPGFIGIPHFLGSPNKEWSWVYGAGEHWLFWPFRSFEVLPTEEVTTIISRFTLDAIDNKDKPEITFIRMDVEGINRNVIFDPWKFLKIAGSSTEHQEDASLEKEGLKNKFDILVKMLISAMRKESTKYDQRELRKNQTPLEDAAQTAADEKSEHWGVESVGNEITYIAPTNIEISKADEDIAVEQRQKVSERIQTDSVVENSRRYTEAPFNLSGIDALATHGSERGKGKRTQIIFSGAAGSDLTKAGAQAAAAMGAAFSAGMESGRDEKPAERTEKGKPRKNKNQRNKNQDHAEGK